jgi:hypothetical protein
VEGTLMRIIAIIAGLILLLPGLCSIVMPLTFMRNGEGDPLVGAILIAGLLITWLAGWLILRAGKPGDRP